MRQESKISGTSRHRPWNGLPSPRPSVSPLPKGEGPGGEGRPLQGRWREVPEILDSWRIDDEWWRKRTVSRLYFSLALADGRMVTVYQDAVSGRWYQQAY